MFAFAKGAADDIVMWHVTKAELGHHERVAEIKEHNSEIGLPVSQAEI